MKILILFIFIFTSGAFAASTRSIDADVITSSDKTKTYTLPSATTTLDGINTTATLTGKTMSGASNTFSQLPIAGQYVTDAFSGNGSTTVFTLTQTPASSSEVKVFQNGILLTITSDYTISGTSLTIITAPALAQKLTVIYSRY